MKKVELSIKEFYNFKELARMFRIEYLFETLEGCVIVEADCEMLESLGY